jgi:(p)ppGpp synthase/HD superfamily hydrolase
LECGGTETEAAAALLHDAVEDQGGRRVLEDIRDTFGPEVAAIVDGCTDAYTVPKPPWEERKRGYLESLKSASPSVLLVSLADKVHNARSLLRELNQHGSAIWESFRGGKEGTLWYYRELTARLEDAPCPYLVSEFKQLVDQLHHTAQKTE